MTFPRQTSRLASAAGIICALVFLSSISAIAQGFGGRTASVSVSEASEEVLAIFSDVQGRVAAGQATAITATTNAVTVLEELQLGDAVKRGQLIAVQDATDLKNRLALLEAQQDEAELQRKETLVALSGDKELLALLKAQLTLLEGKAKRAESLVARNALAVDAGETARNAVFNVQQQIAQRRATLTSRDTQLALADAALARIALEIGQVKTEIKAARITAPADG